MHGEGEAVRQNASSLALDACLDTPIAEADLRPHTYPLTLLYGLQALPTDNELAALHSEYCDTFGTHVYVSDIGAEGILARSNPSYLQLSLAVACIASVFSDSPAETQNTSYDVSEQLCQAGFHLWLAILEVDGRETRSARTVVAAALLSTYGILAPGSVIKRKTAGLLSNVANVDLPDDLGLREDALALSIALLSNIIRTHKTYFVLLSSRIRPDTWNPYRPLTWRSELANAIAVFNTALARWGINFLQQADHDVLALHYFKKLYLMVPSIGELPSLARGGMSRPVQLAEQMTIPDEALEIAWDVFEHVDSAVKVKNHKMSIWLPEITFLSALTVWHSHSNKRHRWRYGGIRSLIMYQKLLLQLQWPCCIEMAAVLDLAAQQG
ncbi:hypothetical protein FGADI_12672 [Fusarium gaditjirri]|uniref:Transcription factor n=1 Tax=Fusarium gaditjirri TaxID=282569 RepID=A0A8H4WNU9_9HYPO|nr:hypothetical protein FGADI_12672 [Fusarium gaditjirri]